MRSLTLSIGCAALAATMLGCASAPPAAETPAAAPKASAPMVVADFEDASRAIVTFAGPKSSIKTEYVTDIVHSGKSALKVTENTSDWTGALLEFKEEGGDWSSYSQLRIWIYGSKNGQYFNIDFEDKGMEQFRYSIANDFQGWQEFVIPFSKVPVRSDYQAPSASRNGHIDWPLKTLQFCTASNFKGSLVFDDISVEP